MSAQASLDALDVTPGVRTSSSRESGWRSVIVETFRHEGPGDDFELPPSPDQLVVIQSRGRSRVESFSTGKWRGAELGPGLGGLTAGGMPSRLRWNPIGAAVVETTHIYIAAGLFDATLDEFRRAGRKTPQPPDTLELDDPMTTFLANALVQASEAKFPDLYADSAAQFLSTHLLERQGRLGDRGDDTRRFGTMLPHRMAAVLAYMDVNYAKPLSLARIAEEAGVSRFHFVQIFRSQIGQTPYQHLVGIRLNAAADMLMHSNVTIGQIATSCGFASASHFAKMFRLRFGVTPSRYRQAGAMRDTMANLNAGMGARDGTFSNPSP